MGEDLKTQVQCLMIGDLIPWEHVAATEHCRAGRKWRQVKAVHVDFNTADVTITVHDDHGNPLRVHSPIGMWTPVDPLMRKEKVLE